MKLHHLLALASLLPLAAPATPSDPVGALRLKLRGGSDTMVTLPLHRPALAEAHVVSRSSADLTLDVSCPSLPPSGAYALVMSGLLEGAILPATTANGTTLTVDAAGYDLSSLDLGVNGDLIALIPYWTLDTVFPAGAGVQISTNRLAPKSQVLLYDDTLAGTNLAPSETYFYFSGNGTYPAGWYRFGDMSTLRGGTRLPPQKHFVVRHPTGAPDTELLLAGQVQLAGFRTPVRTLVASRDQDNLLAQPVPVPLSIASTGLHESGAFASSANRLNPTDQLLVYDNTLVGQNKSPSATYFYFIGNGSYAAGWYRFGDMSQSAANVMLKPGEGFVIRKHSTITPERLEWNALPSYLQ